jgi:hypothetical protein
VDLGERDFCAVIGDGDDDGAFLPGGVLDADDRGLANPGVGAESTYAADGRRLPGRIGGRLDSGISF